MIGQVEGHQVHRIARDHRKTLVGLSFHATSPNGRFSHGALQIDSKHLSRIEVHGKYMFYVRFCCARREVENRPIGHTCATLPVRTMSLCPEICQCRSSRTAWCRSTLVWLATQAHILYLAPNRRAPLAYGLRMRRVRCACSLAL